MPASSASGATALTPRRHGAVRRFFPSPPHSENMQAHQRRPAENMRNGNADGRVQRASHWEAARQYTGACNTPVRDRMMKSSLGPAALNFLNRQLQTGCSEFFERAAPSAKDATPPAARRKILNRTGGRGTYGSRRRSLQCVRARRIFASEQRQRAATIGKVIRIDNDSRPNLEWKQRSHPLSSAGAWKAAAQPAH